MGRKSRTKGARMERHFLALLQQAGFTAEKVSRSGYTGHDLSISLIGQTLKGESKVRADGFKELYGWLEKADLLLIKADRKTPLIVVPWKLALDIARATNR